MISRPDMKQCIVNNVDDAFLFFKKDSVYPQKHKKSKCVSFKMDPKKVFHFSKNTKIKLYSGTFLYEYNLAQYISKLSPIDCHFIYYKDDVIHFNTKNKLILSPNKLKHDKNSVILIPSPCLYPPHDY